MVNLQPDSLLMAGDVARMFSVSAEAVRKWERSGRLQARRTVSGVRLFLGVDVTRLQRERAAARAGVLEATATR